MARPDALSGDAEDLSDFLQGVGASVVHAEPHAQHIGFTVGQRPQNLSQRFGQESIAGCVGRTGGVVVLYEGADGGVLFVADRRVQRECVGRGAVGLDDLLYRQAEIGGDFLQGRFPAQFLYQLSVTTRCLVDDLDHMYRNADGPRLVRDGPGYRLPDPPRRVGRELVSLGIVKFVHGSDQACVSLLD